MSFAHDVSTSTRDIAGQRSHCYTVIPTRGPGLRQTGCLSDQGIFTFSDDGAGTVVELSGLEDTADDSLFATG